MKLIDIDIHRPDVQTLRAALELLADGHIILFPAEQKPALLSRFSPTNRERMAGMLPNAEFYLVAAEDSDEAVLAAVGLPLFKPDHTRNRAFHTLVQLCDFPILATESAVDRPAHVEYGFRATD